MYVPFWAIDPIPDFPSGGTPYGSPEDDSFPSEDGMFFDRQCVRLASGLDVLVEEAINMPRRVDLHLFPNLKKQIEEKTLPDRPFNTIIRVARDIWLPLCERPNQYVPEEKKLRHYFINFDGSTLMSFGVPGWDSKMKFTQACLAKRLGALFSRNIEVSFMPESSKAMEGEAWTAANRLFRFLGKRLFFTKGSILASHDGRAPGFCVCHDFDSMRYRGYAGPEGWGIMMRWARSPPGYSYSHEAFGRLVDVISWVCEDIIFSIKESKSTFYLWGGECCSAAEVAENTIKIIRENEEWATDRLEGCFNDIDQDVECFQAMGDSGHWIALLLQNIPIHSHILRTVLPDYKYLEYSYHQAQPVALQRSY